MGSKINRNSKNSLRKTIQNINIENENDTTFGKNNVAD